MSAIPLLTLNISGPMARRSVTVDRNGATLGRGADCTVVLADERRAISRVQAHIEWRGDRFTVIDIGGNPTLVNGNALDASREAILHDGDTLSIGAYLIDVVLEGDAATARGTVRGAATLVAPLPERARAPRDATPTPPPTLSSTPRGNPFPAVPDEPFFAMPAAALTVLRVRTNAAGRSAAPALAKQTVHMDQRDAGTRAATIAPPEKPPASEEPRSAVPVQNDTASPDAVIAALCEGLGIERGRTDGHPPLEFARLIGSLLRDALQGTMEALRVRSGIKQQTHAAMTMIATRDNNALKLLPDAEGALAQMLGSDGGAWLTPHDALHEALRDLRNHECALAAGVHAALHDVLFTLAPAEIEARLRPLGRIEAALSSRDARLWAIYVDTWQQMKQRAGDSIEQALPEPSGERVSEPFGESFARAYQAKLDAITATDAADDRFRRDASSQR